MRIVDDLAGQEDVAAGEPAPRLVGIVDRAVDAVAEPELACEADAQTARLVAIAVGAYAIDDRAVVGGGQLAGDRLFHVEALAENQRLGRMHFRWGIPFGRHVCALAGLPGP